MTLLTRQAKSLWSYNPLPTGCVLFLPLWHPNMQGLVVKTPDPFGQKLIRTGGVPGAEGITFDGDDDIDITTVLTSALASLTVGTLIVWYRPDAVPPAASEIIVSFGDTDAASIINIGNGSDSTFRAAVQNAGSTKWFVDTDAAGFTSEIWSCVGVVQDGISPILYKDGIVPNQAFATELDKTVWFSDIAGLDNGLVGAKNDGGTGKSAYISGRIAEVYINKAALTADQMLYYCNHSYPRRFQ